jgi:probable HAF family extracellular repeat protein
MKSRTLMCTTAITLFAALALPVQLAAQHTRYKLIDIPTLGGPAAIGQVDGPGISQFINNSGVVVGGSDTTAPDPFCLNPGCFLVHAFRWQDGVVTDLGSLPGLNFSHATSINARGWATGGSFTALFDPLKGAPAEHAVLWRDGEIIDLGTLGTGLESAGLYVNNAGEVVGFSTFDTMPVPSFLGATIHAFIWKNGEMKEIVPPGSRGSFPSGGCNNQRSDLVAGNDDTGMFLWQNGIFTEIPTLGGSSAFAQCANNQGQVIGGSNLPGDPGCPDFCVQHAFSWDHGTLTDLGSLGGSNSTAIWLNNTGEAVGGANTAGDASFHATLWRNGQIADLGTLDGDCFSIANAINSSGQIIGQSFACDFPFNSRAVVWDHGSIIDLNAAIPPNATLQLVETDNINERGEIVGRGAPPGCDNLDLCGHVFLLIPCAGGQGCEGKDSVSAQIESPAITTTSAQRRHMTKQFVAKLRARLAQRYHIPGLGASPRD